MIANRCVYCDGELLLYRRETLSSAHDEINLSSKVNSSELPSISHGKCTSCSSVIANDLRMTDAINILDAYTDAPATYVYDHQAFQSNLPFYKKIENLINPDSHPMTICDVGCNSGHFLQALENYWDKFGVEPGSLALELLEDPSIKTYQGTLVDSPFIKKTMDCLTYFDVFEHLINPKQEIEVAKSFLKRDGKLVILTGNATSRTAKIAGPTWTYLSHVGHIAVPSEKALTDVLKEAGFIEIEVHKISHPYSRSLLDWIVLLALSKILRSPARMNIFNRTWTVPLLYDHMLIIAKLKDD